MVKENSPARIKILDGFRALAILGVMLLHYFSRYTPPLNPVNLYPYGGKYNFFLQGHLGVEFFFIISGFVIFFTLERTDDMTTFWKKRLIRLLPSMVVASAVTLLIFRLFDGSFIFPESHKVLNFFTSLTFIKPNFFNLIFNTSQFSYLNASYWSLWPEVQFYLFASVIYYLSRRNFVRNFGVVTIAMIILNELSKNIAGHNTLHIHLPQGVLFYYTLIFTQYFNLITYIPFFCSGVFLYLLFKNRHEGIKTSLFIKGCLGFFMVYIIYSGEKMPAHIINAIMFLLFFGFIYYPERMRIFQSRIIAKIGFCSYFLYLIHESIGVFIINTVGKYFLPIGFLFPLLVMGVFIVSSIWYSEVIEKRLTKAFKELLIKPKPKLPPIAPQQADTEATAQRQLDV
jgi:peptidoglycan/LPS O-acetylase OafA/YrhL